MNIIDRFQDFRFRLGFEENSHERNALEHFDEAYRGASFDAKITAALVTPDLLRTWGTDHSRWDGNVDFSKMREMGARFTFIKAMEGTVPTTYYVENTLRAIGEGLAVAPYHWLHQNAKVNCKVQAQTFWGRVNPYVKKLPPLIDFEWTYWSGVAAYPNYTDLDIFVTEFTRISGIKPLWYSAPGYMNLFGKMPASLRAKFAGFVVANYGVLIPNMPMDFTQDDWKFWQFAATGDAEKISPNDAGKKEVDLIYSNLTQVVFDEKYSTGESAPTQPPEPPTGEPMPNQTGTINTSERYIRNGAGVSNTHIATLYRNDTVIIDDTEPVGGYDWYHIIDARRSGQPVITLGGLTVNQREDCWIYGESVVLSPVEPPTPGPTPTFEQEITLTIRGASQIYEKKQ